MPSGGRRKGAGRKSSQSSILTRRKAAALIERGESPLDVLMSNVRWWVREVDLLEKGIRANMPAGESILRLEKSAVLVSYFDARNEMKEAAVDAAPYVHPRMSPTPAAKGPGESMKDLSNLTDDELENLERISRKIAGAYGIWGGGAS